MPFLDRREAESLREFGKEENCFLFIVLGINCSSLMVYFFLEVLGHFGCEEGSFWRVGRGPGGQGTAASQLQVPLGLRGSGQPERSNCPPDYSSR